MRRICREVRQCCRERCSEKPHRRHEPRDARMSVCRWACPRGHRLTVDNPVAATRASRGRRELERMSECTRDLALTPGILVFRERDNRDAATRSRTEELLPRRAAIRESSRAPDGRRRGRCCPGRRDSHPRLDVVPPHYPALVGHWDSCSDAALFRTLLSYGTRWRAASPMRA